MENAGSVYCLPMLHFLFADLVTQSKPSVKTLILVVNSLQICVMFQIGGVGDYRCTTDGNSRNQ